MTKKCKHLRRYAALYVMMIPGMLYLLINNYLPMAGIVTAFKDIDYRKGIFGSDWIGFKNFEYLFATQDAWIITRNTLGYNLLLQFFQQHKAVHLRHHDIQKYQRKSSGACTA